MSRLRCLCAVCLTLPVICLGCGGTVKTNYRPLRLVKVWGRVTLDGEPLAGGFVVFESSDQSYSWGRTNDSGNYYLMFNSERKGTTPGAKTVRIHTAGQLGEASAPIEGELTESSQPERIPPCYNTNSRLKVTIGTSSQRADFDLVSRHTRLLPKHHLCHEESRATFRETCSLGAWGMSNSDQERFESRVIHGWLEQAVEEGASDLHVIVGHRPTIRLHGGLRELPEDQLDDATVRQVLMPLCPTRSLEHFERHKNVDFAVQLEMAGRTQRFRVNYFVHHPHIGACFRIIPHEIPDYDWAGYPTALADRLAHFRNGLVLISGVAGAGKTTTLAMIINQLNLEGGYRIITVEDPIEYVFPCTSGSVVTQREVGHDVESFADGLKYGLRQDPDVILVGEIRDRPTAQMALSAAETGHLVFSTLHTRDAKGAISRYADLFPQSSQSEIRSQLSMSLRAVVSQHLLPSCVPDTKRELALEVLFNNAAISSAIRFGKIESIDTNILTGRSDGMITLDESVKRLLQAEKISRETASRFVTDKRFLS